MERRTGNTSSLKSSRINHMLCLAGSMALCSVWSSTAAAATTDGVWLSSGGSDRYAPYNPRFTLDLSTPQTVTIDLTSDVDTYLYLMDETGFVMLDSDDDGGAGLNSQLTYALDAGKYQIVAATFHAEQMDAFNLTTSAGTLRAHQKSGWTSSSGRSLDYGNPRFMLLVPEAQLVTLDLMSDDDTYMYLLNEVGNQLIAEDDDSGDDRDSRLFLNLPAGHYQVVAGSYYGDKSGDFTLTTSAGVFEPCIVGHEDANFSGDNALLCFAYNEPFASRSYSSFSVPRGLWARGIGTDEYCVTQQRTYYRDASWVGESHNDLYEGFDWSEFEQQGFLMAVMADPQFAWSVCDDDHDGDNTTDSPECDVEQANFPNYDDEVLSTIYNDNVVSAINDIHDYFSERWFGGVIINGDLTEFGDQGSDLGSYISTYELGLEANVYPGLGNHDYENNVNDCLLNECVNFMVSHFIDEVESLNPTDFDHTSSTGYSFPQFEKHTSGSLGYSWDLGEVHYVQLNNHASYTASWNGWNFSAARRDYYDITASMAWLRADLEAAENAGKTIILNLHDWDTDISDPYDSSDDTEFEEIVSDFPVTAIFAGHHHRRFGRVKEMSTPYGYVPVYFSGAPHYGQFLMTRIVDDTLYVWEMVVDHYDDGKLYAVKGGTRTQVTASNMATIFDVSQSTYYYEETASVRR